MFEKIGLRGKIFGGIGLVVALSAVVIISYQLTVNRVTTLFTSLLEHEVAIAEIAHDLDAATMDYERSVEEFLLQHLPETLKDMEEFNRDSRQSLQALQEMAAKNHDTELGGRVEKISGLLKTYVANLKKVVDGWQRKGLTEKEGLQGAFRAAVHAIENTLKANPDPDLEIAMLTIRRHEKDYMLRGTAKYIDATRAAVAAFKTAVAASPLSAAVQQTLLDQAGEYQKNFDALVAQDKVIAAARQTMLTAYHQMGPVVDKIVDIESSAAEREAAQAKAVAVVRGRISMAIGVIGIALGLVLAYFLGRGIARPISQAIIEIKEGANQVGSAASMVASGSQILADTTSDSAAALEETSASMEEMSSMTRQNNDNAAQADQLMQETIDVVRKANEVMNELTVSMSEIAQASEETSKIIKTIDEIAFQTNLLALNAAVEAARAGEAGAGFAVVAEEVRNLAMRSAEAAKNTNELIQETVQKVGRGGGLVQDTSQAFKEVDEYSAKIAQLIREVATASAEQTTGVGQVNQAVTQLDQSVQQIAANSEETASAAEEMASQVASINEILANLTRLVNGAEAAAATMPPAAAAPLRRPPVSKSAPKPALPPAPTKDESKAAPPKEEPAKPAAARKDTAKAKPEDVIPFDDDDGDFEDF